ncbi:MAG TPA: PA2778 family cysteine peptidase [Burkholderiales bacterium]
MSAPRLVPAPTCAGGAWRALALAGAFLLAACAALQSERLARAPFAEAVELHDVAFFPQEDYQCGPAALATVLERAGVRTTPAALAAQVYLPARRGSLQLELLAAARRHGVVPYVLAPRLEALLAEVQAGHPVVVLQNLAFAWYPRWHYAVVVGFDLTRDELILRSGRERRRIVPLRVFERTWRRGDYWAMVALPPGVLPRTAEELPYLQAVVALERLQRWEEARRAYDAALERWPASLGAQLGLGNAAYALGDRAGAERAYRAAASRHPDAGIAFNNLAQVLVELGRLAEAEEAIARALALGGPHAAVFRETAAEIRARRAGYTELLPAKDAEK